MLATLTRIRLPPRTAVTQPETVPLPPKSIRRLALLVEFRDEVVARLWDDLESLGFTVRRARSAHDADQHLATGVFDLVLANVSQPDESGWLMVSKWRISRSRQRVWLYNHHVSPVDRHWSQFTRVEQLIDYGGDLFRLSEVIRLRLPEAFPPRRLSSLRRTLFRGPINEASSWPT